MIYDIVCACSTKSIAQSCNTAETKCDMILDINCYVHVSTELYAPSCKTAVTGTVTEHDIMIIEHFMCMHQLNCMHQGDMV